MKHFDNLSANVLQLILNQFFGLGIFYLLSTGLTKTEFGQINLALAVLLAVFNILSMGIDQIVIKRISAGAAVADILSLYIGHVLLGGAAFYGLLFCGRLLFPNSATVYQLILLLGAGKLAIFFSTPFKQIASGLEKFKTLAYMSVASNLARGIGLVIIWLTWQQMNMMAVVAVFVAGDVVELLWCVWLFKRSVSVPRVFKWDKVRYLQLIKEALPQSGVVIITSALARFDWIFIGLILSAQKLAEYSFAYKIFEMATLPLTAIAPLLIPRFTRLFQTENAATTNFKTLVRIEMVIAGFIGLLLNVYWSPAIDGFTHGKYGAVNSQTFFLLSLSMPLLYINNILWTVFFAQGRLHMIFRTFVITLLVNIAGDVVLIPTYRNEGAAIAFLFANLAQTTYFVSKNSIPELKTSWQPFFLCIGCAISAGLITLCLLPQNWLTIPVATVIYVLLLLLTRQMTINDRQNLRELLNW